MNWQFILGLGAGALGWLVHMARTAPSISEDMNRPMLVILSCLTWALAGANFGLWWPMHVINNTPITTGDRETHILMDVVFDRTREVADGVAIATLVVLGMQLFFIFLHWLAYRSKQDSLLANGSTAKRSPKSRR